MSKLITVAKLLFPISLGLLAAGCGSPDFKYGCEQQQVCASTNTSFLFVYESVDQCDEVSAEFYDALDSDSQGKVSDAYDACKDKTGCEWTDCYFAAYGTPQ